MALDLTVFDVPMNNEQAEDQVLNYEQVEKLIREEAELIENYDAGSLGKLKNYMLKLHKAFSEDSRIVTMMTPEARAKYFRGLEILKGSFLDDVVTKPKAKAKTKKSMLPDVGEL